MNHLLTEFYNILIEAVSPSEIKFVKGKRDMTGNVLRNNKELGSLFSKELDKVGNNPDRITKTNIDSIYNAANPGLKKHIDNMKSQRGDEWYKPKRGYGFTSNSQLKHAKHIVLAGDARLIQTKLRNGKFDYSITNHGVKGAADYQHVLDYIKKVRDTAEQPKPADSRLMRDKAKAQKQTQGAHPTVKQLAMTINVPVDRLLSSMKDAGLPHSSADAPVSTKDKNYLLTHLKNKGRTFKNSPSGRMKIHKNPSAPKQGYTVEPKKKSSLFDRLKSVVGRRK